MFQQQQRELDLPKVLQLDGLEYVDQFAWHNGPSFSQRARLTFQHSRQVILGPRWQGLDGGEHLSGAQGAPVEVTHCDFLSCTTPGEPAVGASPPIRPPQQRTHRFYPTWATISFARPRSSAA